MNYCVIKGKTQFVALAKMESFTCDNPDPITEPGEIWFEFGTTPEEALINLKKSLKKEIGAATESGLYNCHVCGEEKCLAPDSICCDCAKPPTEKEISSWVTYKGPITADDTPRIVDPKFT